MKNNLEKNALKMISMFYEIVEHIQIQTKKDAFLMVNSVLYTKIVESLFFYNKKIKPFINYQINLLPEKEMKKLVKQTKQKKLAVYHKPTKTWVYFRERKDKLGITSETQICLCLKADATVFSSKEKLNKYLLMGSFNLDPHYGKNNFLEFQIKKV